MDRLRYVYWRAFPGAWIALALAALSALFATQLTAGPPWAMWALACAFLALPVGFGLVEYARGGRLRRALGLEILVRPGADVDIDQWLDWYEEHWWRRRWQHAAKRRGRTRAELHGGARVEFVAEAPTLPYYDSDGDATIPDVDDGREGIQSYGQHWPDERRIVVHAPEAMGPVCLHELDLLAAEVLWPGQSEREDIEKLKELGVR